MKAFITNYLSGLAVLLLTSVGAYAQPPSGPYTDNLLTGGNIKINSPANVSTSFGAGGMTLTLTSGAGSEWYWSDGGGVAYSNTNNLAFSLNPSAGQDLLTIDVTSISGGTLQLGAFFFNSSNTNLGNELGASKGGVNITTPGVYTLNMNTLATNNALTTAVAWKGDFYYNGPTGTAATISELEAVPEPSTYLLIGLGLFMLIAVQKFRRGSALKV